MSHMASGVRWEDRELRAAMRALDPSVYKAMFATVSYIAPQAESWARTNAPWTDRTGNARNGLRAIPIRTKRTAAVVVHHSVPYGIWLEVRWSGRYAIINKTVRKFGPQAMKMVGQLMRSG